jgi:multiple sugar transport system permease protein
MDMKKVSANARTDLDSPKSKLGIFATKRRLREQQLAYLLIFPALVVILAIAIWPVIQSFYLSTFDLRLSDPTKREAFLSYQIDIATYSDNYQSLLRTFDNEINKAQPPVQTQLQELKATVQQVNQQLNQDPSFTKRYEQVRELQRNLQPVPHSLEYFTLSKTTATNIRKQLDQVGQALLTLQNQDQLNRPKDIMGSFHIIDQSIIAPNFIGLGNYKQFLSDPRMWNSLKNTVIFTVISVTAELVLGFLIALLINKSFKGRGLVRAAVLVPWAIPTVISAKMWLFMYNGEYGIVAKFFSLLHVIPDMGVLLVNKYWQMFSVIFADVWKTTPYMALLLLAGLQTIPDSLYEAAMVDGANRWQQLTRITLPLMKSSILVALLFRTLDAFRVFDLIYVLLGHSQNSEVITTYAYQKMFAETDFGAGSALSVIVFICVALISMGFVKLLGSDLIDDKK